MAFRMIPVGRARKVKKVKSESSQEVLRKLQEYLDDNCEKYAVILQDFWRDQQDALTYEELQEAVQNGDLSIEMLKAWRQDYSILVAGRLRGMWTSAAVAGASAQKLLKDKAFEFNMQSPGILHWLDERGAELVTVCTDEQKDAIAALVGKKMRERHTVDELARLIRPCVGLTKPQAEANARFYDNMVSELLKDNPRMNKESAKKKARDAAAKYAERQHRQRAFTIAQTESAYAYNRGADEGIRQAQGEGLIGAVIKKWSTAGNENVCSLCESLEGVEVGMDGHFNFGRTKLKFEGQDMLPPAHPRCACAVEYIEVGL